jgi:tetratricopeptide (TPR) repeat protein
MHVQHECALRTADHLKIRAVTGLRQGPSPLYLGGMAVRCAMALRWACSAVVLAVVAAATPAAAQDTPDDAAGREYFERGRDAFERADYESALVYFRHAYRLSRRGELQYNIGVAADRLQREEEALEAFRHYLEETERPTREAEVRERIDALQRSIAERKATELALEEATTRYRAPDQTSDGARVPTSAIIGGSTLAAVGVAGVAAMGVGLAKNGTCKQEVAGRCVVEHSATAWTWIYGGLGVAALAGSATWFAISAKRMKNEREATISFTPTGLVVSGKF